MKNKNIDFSELLKSCEIELTIKKAYGETSCKTSVNIGFRKDAYLSSNAKHLIALGILNASLEELLENTIEDAQALVEKTAYNEVSLVNELLKQAE